MGITATKRRLKRYQFYGKQGIQWTPWFPSTGSETKWQLKNKLLNEYKDA